MVKFAVLNAKEDLTKVLPVNTSVKVVHTPSAHNQFSFRVYLAHDDSVEVGFINSRTQLEGVKLAKDLHETLEASGNLENCEMTVVEHIKGNVGDSKDLASTFAIVELIEADTSNLAEGDYDFELIVKGSIRENRSKAVVTKSLTNGENPIVGLTVEGDKIRVIYKDEKAGIVDSASKDYDLAYKVIATLKDVTATASMPVNASYTVSFRIGEEQMTYVKTGKKVMTLMDVMEEKSAFIPQETLKNIHQYLENSGLTQKQIMAVMSTYREYDDSVKHRIPAPKQKFIDNFGAIRKTVIYMNKGKHLRLVGEKGTGKNMLTTILAWIYQRPLYELSMNSEIDKLDLLGAKTIRNKTAPDGSPYQVIEFEKEIFVECLEVGGIFNMDEVNTADPAILVMLHSIVDDRGTIEVPSYGRVVADDNFQMILTMNKDYIGTTPLNEATRDRFTPILFPNNRDISKMLQEKVPTAKHDDIDKANRLFADIMNQVEDGTISMDCVTVRGFIDALDVANDLGLREALEDNVVNRIEDEHYRVSVESLLDSIISKR